MATTQTICILHLRAYLATLPTNPHGCSHRVWSRNGQEVRSNMTSLCKRSIPDSVTKVSLMNSFAPSSSWTCRKASKMPTWEVRTTPHQITDLAIPEPKQSTQRWGDGGREHTSQYTGNCHPASHSEETARWQAKWLPLMWCTRPPLAQASLPPRAPPPPPLAVWVNLDDHTVKENLATALQNQNLWPTRVVQYLNRKTVTQT